VPVVADQRGRLLADHHARGAGVGRHYLWHDRRVDYSEIFHAVDPTRKITKTKM
jgi:hypothetical protein